MDVANLATLSLRVDGAQGTKTVQEFGQAAEKTTRQASLLETGVKTLGTVFAIWQSAKFGRDTLDLAARYQTLGVVVETVGRNAGHSAVEMLEYQASLQKTGISMIESRSNLAKLTAAQINLNNATTLARVAQDAAVIGNLNSSESFARLVHGIQAGQTEVLRTIGINVQFERGYEQIAKQIGVSVDELTDQQRVQARANVVMAAGAQIAGTYEAALGTANKQLGSSARYLEDARVKAGTAFLPQYTQLVFAYADALKLVSANIPTIITGLQVAAVLFAGNYLSVAIPRLMDYVKAQFAQRAATIAGMQATAAANVVEVQAAGFRLAAAQNALRANTVLGASAERLAFLENEVALAQTRVAITSDAASRSQAVLAGATSITGRAMAVLGSAMNLIGGPVGVALLGIYGLWTIHSRENAGALEKQAEAADKARQKMDDYRKALEGASRASLEAQLKQVNVDIAGHPGMTAGVKPDGIPNTAGAVNLVELWAKRAAIQQELTPIVKEEERASAEIAKSAAEISRLADQRVAMAKVEGVAAAHLAVDHKRLNDLAGLDVELKGKSRDLMIAAIEHAATQGHQEVAITAAKERQLDIAKKIEDVTEAVRRWLDEIAEKEQERVKSGKELVAEYLEQARLSGQEVEVSKLQGAAADRLKVNQAAENSLRAVKGAMARDEVRLSKEQLAIIERAIEAERVHGQQIITNTEAFQTQKKVIEDTAGILADGFAQAFSAASGLLAVSGKIGGEWAGIASHAAQIATNLSRIQQISKSVDTGQKDKSGNPIVKDVHVGFWDALKGGAGAAGTAAAVSGALGIIGAAVSLGDALGGLFGSTKKQQEAAEAAAIALRELRLSVRESAASFKLQASGSPLEREIAGIEKSFRDLWKSMIEAGGTPPPSQRTAVFNGPPSSKEFVRIQDLYDKMVAAATRAAELQAGWAEDDLNARLAAANGHQRGAEMIRQLTENEKELEAARIATGGTTQDALIKEVQLAEQRRRDADRARELARASEDLSVRGFATSGASDFDIGSMRRAIEQQREMEDAVLAERDATYLLTLAHVQAAEAAKRLADEQKRVAEENARFRESLVGRGLDALGNTRGAEDARLAASQRQEMADAIAQGMDPTNTALLRFVQFAERERIEMLRAIEDGTKAIRDAAATRRSEVEALMLTERNSASAFLKAKDLEIDAISKASDAAQRKSDEQLEVSRASLGAAKEQISLGNEAVQSTERVLDALRSFGNSLPLGNLSTLSPIQRAAEARRQFDELATRARGGDKEAASGLPAVAQAFLEASRAVNASGAGYVADFNRVREIVAAVTAQFGNTLSSEQAALAAAQQSAAGIETQISEIQKAKDAAKENTQLQVAAIKDLQDAAREQSQRELDRLQGVIDTIDFGIDRDIAELVKIQEGIFNAIVQSHDGYQLWLDAQAGARTEANDFYRESVSLARSTRDEMTLARQVAQQGAKESRERLDALVVHMETMNRRLTDLVEK